MQIAICEDTQADVDTLLSAIKRTGISVRCSVFSNAEAFLEIYRPQMFDLLLTDIYMSGISGVEAVSQIRSVDEDLLVVFITSSSDFALEGYRLSALKYIEKPYNDKDMEDMLRLALRARETAPSMELHFNRQSMKLRLSQILYLEQCSHHVVFHLKDGGQLQICDKLSAYVPELLHKGFFAPHKSYAVNLACVDSIDSDLRCFIMQDGKNIPIRRESMQDARESLKNFLFGLSRDA